MVVTDSPGLRAALTSFVETFDDSRLAGHVGPHLTCPEAEVLATLLLEGGAADTGAMWLAQHAKGDDEGDMHFGITKATAVVSRAQSSEV